MSFIEQRGGLYSAPNSQPKTIVYNGGVTSSSSGNDVVKELQQRQRVYQSNMSAIVKATNERRVRMTVGFLLATGAMPIYILYSLVKPK